MTWDLNVHTRAARRTEGNLGYPGDPEKGERSSLFRVLARTPFISSASFLLPFFSFFGYLIRKYSHLRLPPPRSHHPAHARRRLLMRSGSVTRTRNRQSTLPSHHQEATCVGGLGMLYYMDSHWLHSQWQHRATTLVAGSTVTGCMGEDKSRP